MPIVRIHRSLTLYWIAIATVVGAHVVLCHPAVSGRGYPPLRTDEILLMFVAPFLIGIPALFNDCRSIRQRGVIIASVGMAFVYGTVMANGQTPRPHIGHTEGMLGVIRYCWFEIPILAVGPFIGLCVSLTFYERVFGDFWPLLRGFRSVDARERLLQMEAEGRITRG